MDKTRRDTVLGLVFFTGLGLLLWATAELQDLGFGDRQVLTVDFVNARGLRTGEPVFVLGTLSGKVDEVMIHEGKENELKIRATILLDNPLDLRESTEIKVVDASMLGGKRVEITPGRTGVSVQTNSHVFTGIAPLGPLDALGNMISGPDNKDNLEGVLAGLRKFVDTLNNSEGSLARFIANDTLIREAEELVASLRKTALELEKSEGLLGRIIWDTALGDRVVKIFDDIDKVTTELTGVDSPLGRLINDKAMGEKLDRIVTDVDKVTTQLAGSETALGRIINDKAMGSRFDKIVKDIEEITNAINDKEAGLLGAVINDKELLADAKKTFEDFSEITHKLNNGNGSLARLINDEEMGRRLDSALRQITRAIEDAREAAPIGTFFQVFSGAF